MRRLTRPCIAVLLLISGIGSAMPDLLVASFDGFQVLRCDERPGAFLGVFIRGLPNDRPLSMTAGTDGSLYMSASIISAPLSSPSSGASMVSPARSSMSSCTH